MKLSDWTKNVWSAPHDRRRGRRRAAVTAGVAVLTLTAVLGVGSLTATGADPVTTSGIVLGVGANESQRVVSWYASAGTAQAVEVAPTPQLVNGEFPAGAVTYAATVTANTVNGGFNGHAGL